jgi:anaerobic dimethyl sulfoxide reductase subunit A
MTAPRKTHPNGEGSMQGKGLGFLEDALNVSRRSFIKGSAAGAAAGLAGLTPTKEAKAFAYEPYPTDDELTTVVTSCAHNCGSRHMLVAHKKGNVIVRLSTDDGSYQGDAYGTDTLEVPQVRACLRGRSYRSRIYSPERLLYPMIRVGERGEGKFKRASWDYTLDYLAERLVRLKQTYGPTAMLDQSYAGSSWGALHKSYHFHFEMTDLIQGCRQSDWTRLTSSANVFHARQQASTIAL